MREAIGGTALFQIVIVFILLFTGFMCLTINQSKAFNVKDKIVQTIQNYNGVDLASGCIEGQDSAMCEIVDYLVDNSYRLTGTCPEDITLGPTEKVSYQGFNINGIPDNTHPAFCIAKIESGSSIMNKSCGTNNSTCVVSELPDMSYYRVVVFYQLDLPIFGDLFNFKITGDTKTLMEKR